MSRRLLLTLLAFIASACSAMEPSLSSHPTCQLASPPIEAGENAVHAQLLKVYPRKSTMGQQFTGCQTIWLYGPGESGAQNAPTDLMLLHFRNGHVVSARIEGRLCQYSESGKAEKSNSSACPNEAPEAFLSEPAGCISDPQQRANPSGKCKSEE